MPTHRIILANDSRLVREMLNRIFLKTGNLEVACEIKDHHHLAARIESSDAEWVILSLPTDCEMPPWVDKYLQQHSNVRFLAVAPDGSRVKMKWQQSHEAELSDLSLPDLIGILESSPAELSALQPG